MKRLTTNQRIGIAALLSAVVFALISGTARPGPIVSPLAVERPTLPGELAPESYMPAVMLHWSPLPTPTVRPTP